MRTFSGFEDYDAGNVNLSPVIEAASTASGHAQVRLLRATRLELAMLVVAAGGGWLATIEPSRGAWVAVVAFVVALIARGYVSQTKPDRAWYDGRAAAESAKTLAWRYAVGGRPFSIEDGDQSNVDRRYVEALAGVISALPYAKSDPDAGPQITPNMRGLRGSSIGERKKAYERDRIVDQQNWYARRARDNAYRSGLLTLVVLSFEGFGVALGVAAAAGWVAVDAFGLLAACAAAFGAWLQLKQHDSLARAYAIASQELASIRSLIAHQRTEVEWADFVDQSEEAISREHTLWRASRGGR